MSRATLDRLYGDVGELIARHEGGADLEEYGQYADDPVGFCRDVLDWEPWAAQRDVAKAVVQEPLVTVRSCHAAGKDALAGRLSLWWTYGRGGLVILTSPSQTQTEEILMRGEVRTAFRGSGLPGDLHVKALRPGGEGKAGILAKTGASTSALTGFHDTAVLFVITEAQDPEIAHAWDAAFACTTGAADRILTLGNPTETGGRFERAHTPSSDWHAVKIAAADIPNVREGRTVVPGLLTRAGVERFRKEYGEDSPFYRSRVEAEFPETAEDSLVKAAWLTRATEAHAEGRFEEDRERHKYTVAVDVARFGRDASVACIRRGRHVEGFRRWQGEDTQAVARAVLDLVRELTDGGRSPVKRVVVDAVGIGAGVADKLRELLAEVTWMEDGRSVTRRVRTKSPALVEFNGGAKAKAPKKFRNLRSQAYWHVRKRLEEDQIALPDHDRLLGELRQTRTELTADGKVALETKERTKARLGGSSPDYADALSMSFLHDLEDPSKTRIRWR